MNWNEFKKRVTYYLFGPHLEKNEQILHIVHRHPFLMFKAGLKIAFLHFFLPIFIWYIFPEVWFIFLVWIIYGFIAMNIMVFNWYFDAIIISDINLIDVKWNGPFDRSSVRVEYSKIEGIELVLKHLSYRINHGIFLNESVPLFLQNEKSIEEDFLDFFEDLIKDAKAFK